MSELYTRSLFNDASLVSYWRLEGNSNDSKSSNNGTDTSITYNTSNGKFTQGAGFSSGSNSRIEISNNIVKTGSFTWHFWMNPTVNNNDLITNVDFSVDFGYMKIGTNGSNKLVFNVYANPTSTNAAVTSNASISTSTWTSIDCVRDGTNIIIYINGVYDNQTAWSTAQIATDRGTRFGISKNGAGWLSAYSGAIDDISLFSRALTAAEILALYNQGVGSLFYGQI
jgi:hypothetical protein